MDELPFSVADCWFEPWDKARFKKWALKMRRTLLPREVDLGLVFISPGWAEVADEIVDVLRNSVGVPRLAGCSANGVIANQWEFEQKGGITVGLFHLPGSRIESLSFSPRQFQEAASSGETDYWRRLIDPGAEGINGWLVFAEPLQIDVESWLESWDSSFPRAPLYGGLAHFDREAMSAVVIADDFVLTEGGVAIGIGGGVGLAGLTAQGCTPIGNALTVTRAKGNILERLGNRPALSMLENAFQGLDPQTRKRSKGNVFLGLAVDEYVEDFQRGDFLVRNLLASSEPRGSLAVGVFPRVGQTAQFQIRDRAGASEELELLVARSREELRGKRVFGACLSDCSGRGSRLFGQLHHDSKAVYPLVQPQGVVGFFGNGEFGPVGGKNFVHGYTASVAVFTEH